MLPAAPTGSKEINPDRTTHFVAGGALPRERDLLPFRPCWKSFVVVAAGELRSSS